MRPNASTKAPYSLAHLLLRRLALAYFAFALVIFGAQLFYEYRLVKNNIDKDLSSLASTFAPQIESALWDYQKPLLSSMVEGIGANPEVARVEINDLSGNNISTSWQASNSVSPSPSLLVQKTLFHNDGKNQQVIGSLKIAAGDDIVLSRLGQTILSIVITDSALFLCLGVFLLILVRTMVVKPLATFSKQVRAMSTGKEETLIDLGIVEVEEIHTLTNSFNQHISERKQSEHRNEVLIQRHQALMSSALEGIHIMDIEGNVVECNDTFRRMLGYTEDEAKHLNVSDWDAQWSKNELMERFKELIHIDGALFETKHRKKDGSLLSVEVSTTGAKIDGKYYLYASTRDITERKKIEDEQRIAAATFNTQEAILITTPDAKILRVNQAFEEITGFSAADVIGRNPKIFQSGQHDAEFYRQMWTDLLDSGKWSGEIWDKRKDGNIFPKLMTITAVYNDEKQLTNYVAVFRDISNRKKSEQEIHLLAFFDPLTSLPNRRHFTDRLQQVLANNERSGRYGALLFLDLDHFKTINDTKGHVQGDKMLIEVAGRLQNCLREGDSLARLGGDEFVVLLEDLSSSLEESATLAETVAEKIRGELGKVYSFGSYENITTVSIGINLFFGNTENAEELLKHSDIAMYQAKTAGRNTIRFFDPDMQASLEERAALVADLRRALDKQQFHLYYQIQVDSSGQPLGAEALIRWLHPERGLVPPIKFIPLAEESDLILAIGQWVIDTACAQIKDWEQNPLTRDLILAVNVSAKQFHEADFVSRVKASVKRHGINPQHLELELTEGMLLENIEETIAAMYRLHEFGVKFSLDDFGTGYSSLQYLKRLPLDQIKIDQSFVRDIALNSSDKVIVSTIISMGDSLYLDVIAEGVETEDQKRILLKQGCTRYQGYLFGQPMPSKEFEMHLIHFQSLNTTVF